jgi:hypothetical protein
MGVNYFAVAGKICLLPGYVVGYAVLHKVPMVSVRLAWAELAIAIAVNAVFCYAYSRYSKF